jgi:peptidoglycan hydrolase-like protein with peptidoglycan-binding domain
MMNSVLKNRLESMSGIAVSRHDRDSKKIVVAISSGTFSRALGFGDRGDDVKTLQLLLKKMGFFQGAFVTPFFGEQTQSAVSAFQLSNGLISAMEDPHAGKVETRTLELLNRLVQG